jgi:hypothetical protein
MILALDVVELFDQSLMIHCDFLDVAEYFLKELWKAISWDDGRIGL